MKPRCPHCGEELAHVVEQEAYEDRVTGQVHLQDGEYLLEVVTGRLMGDCTLHGQVIVDKVEVR
jgi:hypothetical protein